MVGVVPHAYADREVQPDTNPPRVFYTAMAGPGESQVDLCEDIAVGWFVSEEALASSFNNWQCRSGSYSTSYPRYPSNLNFIYWPAGTDNETASEIRFLSVYSLPVQADERECGYDNPILPSDGTKIEVETDYIGSGALPLSVVRTYSSAYPLTVSKQQWVWTFGNKLRLDPFQGDGRAIVYYPDQRFVYFKRSSEGTWDAQSASSLRLTEDDGYWKISNFDSDRVETFDSEGRIVKVQKGNSQLSYSYDTVDGQSQTIVSDLFGKTLQVYFNTDGDPERVVNPAGDSIWYVYGGDTGLVSDNLTSVTYGGAEAPSSVDGSTRYYHYENNAYPSGYGNRLLTGITDERGIRYSTFEYTSVGFSYSGFRNYFYANASEHAGGVYRHEIAPTGRSTESINPLGKSTIHNYEIVDGVRKLVSVEGVASANCVSTTQSIVYDEQNYIGSKTDQNGNTTAYSRNDRGLPEKITYAQGASEERVVETQWHEDYRIPEIITEAGRQTTYNYSPYDNPHYTSKTVTDTTTGLSQTWNFTYNSYGQVLTVDGPRSDVSDITTYDYYNCSTGGRCGQLRSITNALGQAVSYNSYDNHGYPLQITDANGVTSIMTYDARQRITSLSVDGSATTLSYELTGDIERITMPDGTFTEYVWDDARRLVAIFDAQGNRIDWVLDDAGNRIEESIIDPSGTLRKSLSTDFDELSRVRQMISANGGVTGCEYDKNGNLTQVTDAGGRTRTTEYDGLDRLIKEIDAISGETAYTYDDRNNLLLHPQSSDTTSRCFTLLSQMNTGRDVKPTHSALTLFEGNF